MKARWLVMSVGGMLLAGCAMLGGIKAPPPSVATTPVTRTAPPTVVKRYALLEERARTEGPGAKVIFLGDSITQGWETDGKAMWEKHFGDWHAINLGVSGDKTEHVLYRLGTYPLDKMKPEAAVILIGTNNSGRDSAQLIADGVTAVVKRVHDAWPEADILVMDIFMRGEEPGTPVRKKLAEANALIHRQARGCEIEFVDINDRLVDPDGKISRQIMPDFLHLSEKGYAIWAEALTRELEHELKD